MTVSSLPVWRSLLFVPVTAKRFVDGAARRGADAIILDLEDSVAGSEKERARTLVPEAAEIVSRDADGGEHRYGYAEAAARARRLASALRIAGIQPGERVVADGLQAVAEGMTVRPTPWTPPATPTAGQSIGGMP